MGFQDDSVFILSTEGEESVIDTAAVPDYLRTVNPRQSITAETIGDTTIFVNRERTASMTTDTPDYTHRKFKMFHFRVNSIGRDIYIRLDGTGLAADEFHYYTGKGYVNSSGGNSDINLLDTSKTAQEFYDFLASHATYGGKCYIKDNWVIAFDMETADVKTGGDEDDIKVYDNIVGSVEALPSTCYDELVFKVSNTEDKEESEAWFQASSKSTEGFDLCTYKEVSHPDEPFKIEGTQMPHKISRVTIINGVAHFTTEEIAYRDREAGSDAGNSPASFIGKNISSLGLFQNRLFFTAGQNVIMSKTDEYFDFWYASSQYTADDDPIDILMDSKQVNTIESNIFLDGDLIFFGEDQQSLILGSVAQTPDTATLSATSNFRVSQDSNPVASGDNVFFTTDFGGFTGVSEYKTSELVDTKKAETITDNNERLILGAAHHLATSTTRNALMVLTPEAEDTAYVFDWKYQGQERKQSSWSKWLLPDGFSWDWVGFSGSKLLAVIKGYGEFLLCELDYDEQADPGLPFELRLDIRKSPVVLSDGGGLYIDYTYQQTVGLKAYTGGDSDEPGFPLLYSLVGDKLYFTDQTLVSEGDIVHIGYEMLQKYYWNNPVIRDQDGNAQHIDRFTVQQINLKFSEVGEIERVHTGPGRDETRFPFSGRRVTFEDNVVGGVPSGEAEWKFPIRRKVDGLSMGIESTSAYPTVLTDVEWVGEFKQRGRRR